MTNCLYGRLSCTFAHTHATQRKRRTFTNNEYVFFLLLLGPMRACVRLWQANSDSCDDNSQRLQCLIWGLIASLISYLMALLSRTGAWCIIYIYIYVPMHVNAMSVGDKESARHILQVKFIYTIVLIPHAVDVRFSPMNKFTDLIGRYTIVNNVRCMRAPNRIRSHATNQGSISSDCCRTKCLPVRVV